MKNSKLCKKELTQLQSLKQENKQLKLEISKLQRLIDRIDPNDVRLQNINKTKQKFEQKSNLLTQAAKKDEYFQNLESIKKTKEKVIFENIHPIE